MRHKKWLGLAMLIASIATTAVLTQAGGARPNAGPIIIGLVTNSSGFMSAYDGPPDNGVKLAVRDIDAAGGVLGRQLQIVHFDQKTQTSLSATGALNVIGKGAVVVLASCDFDFGSPAAMVWI